MRRHLLDLAVLFAVASLVVLYVVLEQPGLRSITLRAYVLLLGGMLMLALVASAGDAVPKRRRSEFDRALAAAAPQERPLPELERVEREVTLATASAYDLHVRLLPHLREIATARLARTGRRPGPDTLGRWWELLRPDRPSPDNRFGPGISQADLRALVADLERM
ncbi:MAG: hypothetical protein ACRDM1_09810 [Gaiellaceae bacterium]